MPKPIPPCVRSDGGSVGGDDGDGDCGGINSRGGDAIMTILVMVVVDGGND